jgi:hypothetical protein
MEGKVTTLREGLPPLPRRMRALPLDHRGYPIPWFVAWVGPDGKSRPRGEGEPYFTAAAQRAFETAIRTRVCWVCGDRLGVHLTFVIGPMCAVNRVTAEPPCHLDCAEFAALACPFLTRPKMRRALKEINAPGFAIERNPGVCLLWTTRAARTWRPGVGGEGVLFDLGEPERLAWYAQGRAATRAEILESFESGLSILRERAEAEGAEAVADLERLIREAMPLIPAEAAP